VLSTFARAFRTPDLRRKLLFTLLIMVLYRLGTFIPAPGVNYETLQKQTSQTNDQGGVFGLLDLFSGGGLTNLSVFALGIMPYITASIIIQLLRVVIPRFEVLHKEGQAGQTKMTQYTRYLTLGLAVLQSTTTITTARNGMLFGSHEATSVVQEGAVSIGLMILAMTAGTGVIMWMAELITERGVGNGMSLLIFTSIVARFPSSMWSIAGGRNGFMNFIIVVAALLLLIGMISFVEQSQRRIPVQYAKRMVGRRTLGGSSTYIPIKINMAGVIPVIFSSSILSLPQTVAMFSSDQGSGWARWIGIYMRHDSWVYLTFYALLIIFFCFFYTSITFNPQEVSDNMKKYGGFIPGIRAGRPTAEYLQHVMTRINTPGSLYLAIVALIPSVLFISIGISDHMAFGGTTLLIIVGVGLDTVKQIDSQLQQRHYEGFLR